MDKKVIKTSFTLTQKAKHIIRIIAFKLGISQTAVVEIAVRRLAKNEGVEDEDLAGYDKI